MDPAGKSSVRVLWLALAAAVVPVPLSLWNPEFVASMAERVALFLAARGCCSDCGEPLSPGWHADHKSPFSIGGKTHAANGQALCPGCNRRKGARDR